MQQKDLGNGFYGWPWGIEEVWPLTRPNCAARHARLSASVKKCLSVIPQSWDVIHTPTNVTASPVSIVKVKGSEKSIQAHSMVTGGLR